MRVKICYTVEISDHMRRKINEHYGEPGLATVQQVKDWYRSYGIQLDDDLNEPIKEEEQEN